MYSNIQTSFFKALPKGPIARRGTTILELMIAIAVIVILAGLAMVAVTSTSQMSSSRETEGLMRTVMAMKVEFEAQSGERLDVLYGDEWLEEYSPIEPWATQTQGKKGKVGGGETFGTTGDEDEDEEEDDDELRNDDRSERLLFKLFQSPLMEGYLKRKSMLKMIEDFDGDGFPQLKDAWGKEIRYVRVIFWDSDGNIGSDPEDLSSDDVVLHEGPDIFGFLVSAGPDGYFGDEDPKKDESSWKVEDRINLARKHAEDNVVSLDL